MSQDVQRPRHPYLASAFAGGGERAIFYANPAEGIEAANPPAAWLCEEPLKGEGIGTRWHHVGRLLAKAAKADRAG